MFLWTVRTGIFKRVYIILYYGIPVTENSLETPEKKSNFANQIF
jgi:hypothetical protein